MSVRVEFFNEKENPKLTIVHEKFGDHIQELNERADIHAHRLNKLKISAKRKSRLLIMNMLEFVHPEYVVVWDIGVNEDEESSEVTFRFEVLDDDTRE